MLCENVVRICSVVTLGLISTFQDSSYKIRLFASASVSCTFRHAVKTSAHYAGGSVIQTIHEKRCCVMLSVLHKHSSKTEMYSYVVLIVHESYSGFECSISDS